MKNGVKNIPGKGDSLYKGPKARESGQASRLRATVDARSMGQWGLW